MDLSQNNLFKVLYLYANSTGEWLKGSSYGAPDKVDVNLAAKALSGLYTCSSSSINGFNAIEGFSQTWIWYDYNERDNTSNGNNWKTVGFLTHVNCQDYAFGADWKDSSTPRDTSINAQTKLDTLVAMHEMYAA